MNTLSNSTKGLALHHQVEEIYGKVYTSGSLLETVLYWGINCNGISQPQARVGGRAGVF